MTTTMNHSIETSTAAIGNFVYHGLYETVLGEYMGCVPYDKREEANDEIGKLYIDILTDALNDVVCDIADDYDDDFSLEYSHTYHPRYYNFETDAIVFSFNYTDELRDAMYHHVSDNVCFKKFLADNFTSYDGFISFTPNNWSEWKEGWDKNDWRCVSALVWFLLDTNITESEKENYWYDFNEQAQEIIGENYVPWEYAAQFDNGFIVAVRSGFDDEIEQTVYRGYLIDNDSNIVNTYDIVDEYDEDFHMSAFAALEWSDMVYYITNHYSYGCGTHTTRCDMPECLS